MTESKEKVKEIDQIVTFDEWCMIIHGATESIKEKMYTFSDNAQRTGFINHVFDKIFPHLNCIMFKLAITYGNKWEIVNEIAKGILKDREEYVATGGELEYAIQPWDEFFLDPIVHDYVVKCMCMLSNFIFDTSELCYSYGVKFELTVDRLMNLPDGEIADHYLHRISSGEYRDPYDKPKKVAEPVKLETAESKTEPLQPLNGLTLWDLFLNSNDADRVKNKLIAAGHIIVNTNGAEFFKPLKSNTSYEPESLRQALNFNQLLDTKVSLSSPEIVKILSNTFHGFSCHVDTLTAKGMGGKVPYYMALCKLD